jgi:hypothetical protein
VPSRRSSAGKAALPDHGRNNDADPASLAVALATPPDLANATPWRERPLRRWAHRSVVALTRFAGSPLPSLPRKRTQAGEGGGGPLGPPTFKAPITVKDVLNSRMIAYPFWKWPAAQAAVLMRNKRPGNCHIRMLYAAHETKQSGPGNVTANPILVEAHGF